MTYNPNGGHNGQPDPSDFNHPEGYTSYDQQNYGQQDYGQQAYGQPYGQPDAFGAQAAPQQANNMALAALIVGIIGIVFILLFFPLAIVFGIVAIVLGILGMRRAKAIETTSLAGSQGSRKGMAIGGLVTGIIALVVGIVVMIVGIQVAQKLVESGVIEECEQYVGDNKALEECMLRELENNPNFPNP